MNKDLGSYLRHLRVKKNFTLKSISHKIKVRESILNQIENGEMVDKPYIIVKSYITNYAKIVGADVQKVNSMLDKPCSINNLSTQQTSSNWLKFKKPIAAAIVIAILSFGFVIGYQHYQVEQTAQNNKRHFPSKYYQLDAPKDLQNLLQRTH